MRVSCTPWGNALQNNSVVDARKIAEEAMRYAPGYVMPEDTEVYREHGRRDDRGGIKS